MINGKTIRATRKKMHLSQKGLAQGITTQSTVSQLENDSVAPKTEVVTKLLKRLNLKMSDVLIEDQTSPDQVLTKADQLTKNFDYQDVERYLDSIEPNSSFSEEDQSHYTFLKTNAKMWVKKDYIEAVFDFSRILDESAKDKTKNIYAILAMCQIGVAYYSEGRVESATYYFEKIPEVLEKVDVPSNLYWVLFIMNNLTNFWSKLKEYPKSNQYGEKAIAIMQENHTIDFAEQLCFTVGENYGYLNGWNDPKTKKYLAQAWALASFTKNTVAASVIEDVLEENNVTISWSKNKKEDN